MIRERLQLVRPIDAALAAGFAVFALVEEYFIRMPGGWWPYLLAAFTGLVLVRRAFPLLTMLPHVIGPLEAFYTDAWIAGEQTVNFRLWQLVAAMIGTYTVGRCVPPQGRQTRGLIGIGLVAVTALIYLSTDPGDPMGSLFFPVAPYGLGVAVAVQARRTAEAAMVRAAAREQRAREAVMEERVRIARELHDMVAHSVTVMVIQAGAVRRRLEAGREVDRELLRGIEGAGREAVGELRRTLGLLRGEETGGAGMGGAGTESAQPPAGLDRIDELIAQVREAGPAVAVHRSGDPVPVPPAIDLSAFRIVQEALTNVLRHAGATDVTVTIGYEGGALELGVVNDGPRVTVPVGNGHGLIGMRERATLFGGELTAGPRAGGGFAVHARLPLPATAVR